MVIAQHGSQLFFFNNATDLQDLYQQIEAATNGNVTVAALQAAQAKGYYIDSSIGIEIQHSYNTKSYGMPSEQQHADLMFDITRQLSDVEVR